MLCNYSKSVWAILVAMIVTGALRSVTVKLAYQSGFEAPLTVTILYLSGQALAIFVYWADKLRHMILASNSFEFASVHIDENDHAAHNQERNSNSTDIEAHDEQEEDEEDLTTSTKRMRITTRKGSSHGLTHESENAIVWIDEIPWYCKPVIPTLFNLFNSTLRWLSLIFVAASVAEMLISGLELALSVLAARVFRKRLVSNARWIGVGFVITGIIVVGLADYYAIAAKKEISLQSDNDNATDFIVGIALIIGQCILSVLQDISEEIFMQAGDFPPTLLLGLEGIFGLIFGLVLYFTCGKYLGENPIDTNQLLNDRPEMLGWIIGLPLLFLITGIFNIKATEVTSSMTRNVWKNFRTLLVWIIALLLFYLSGNSNIGEAWLVPGSFYILLGFLTMFIGIVIYYWYKKAEEEARKIFEEARKIYEEENK